LAIFVAVFETSTLLAAKLVTPDGLSSLVKVPRM
jgi:hypothetical protein